jgi:hypothetical protein
MIAMADDDNVPDPEPIGIQNSSGRIARSRRPWGLNLDPILPSLLERLITFPELVDQIAFKTLLAAS